MAADHSIAPFPESIDRDRFGDWLSGFTDGEGCFRLFWKTAGSRKYPGANFVLGLRQDDRPVLKLIQSYWTVGSIIDRQDSLSPESKLFVHKTDHLRNVLIPHFEKHPLFAKKRMDFDIWKQGVILAHYVMVQPRIMHGYPRGSTSKWTDAKMSEFSEFVAALKQQRQLGQEAVEIDDVVLDDKSQLSFDGWN